MNLLLRYVRERIQNLPKILALLRTVGNNQPRFFSSTPCGKKAMTPRSSRASGPRSWNIGEASESSIVAARLYAASAARLSALSSILCSTCLRPTCCKVTKTLDVNVLGISGTKVQWGYSHDQDSLASTALNCRCSTLGLFVRIRANARLRWHGPAVIIIGAQIFILGTKPYTPLPFLTTSTPRGLSIRGFGALAAVRSHFELQTIWV